MSNIILKDNTGVAKTYENVLAVKVPNTSSGYATYMEGGAKPEQEKTTDPATTQVIVTPDDGYTLSQVTVNAMPSGSATTPATTITENPSISWDSTNKKIKADYNGSKSITPTISAGYVATGTAGTVSTTGTKSVTAESLDANLVAGNIKAGTTIFNTTGTFTSDATATNKDILTGKSAYINGEKVDGTITPREAVTATITTQGDSVTVSGGFYDEDSVITANITSGALAAEVSSNVSGSASVAATGFTASSSETDYYVTLSTSAGSVKAKATVGTAGYVEDETAETSATAVNVSGNNTKLYIPEGSATTPATTITTNPGITWDSTNKKIKSTYSGEESITPTVVEGYVESGVAGTVSTEGTTSVTAESLNANLIASNVRDGVTIFNTTGTFSDSSTVTGTGKSAASTTDILIGKSAFLDGAQIDGAMANNGATGTTITSQGGTYNIPEGYTSGGTVTAQITATTLDNSIISGQAVEESTGDYAWQSTVEIPEGYHNNQTLTKTFSEIFPAPETPATASQMLLGYQAYNKSGVLMTGTMPNNGAGSTTTLDSTTTSKTIAAGYWSSASTVNISVATLAETKAAVGL